MILSYYYGVKSKQTSNNEGREIMSEVPEFQPKCFVCGAGPEGLTRTRGKLIAPICIFKEEM
jgi:hypothetical protein